MIGFGSKPRPFARSLSPDLILSACKRASLYDVHAIPIISSTSDVLRDWARDGARSGTVLLAEAQTAGRGRMGRSFYSPRGAGIYLSLLLRPEFSASEVLRITHYAAVAVARAIESIMPIKVDIKWVNDLLCGGKKVAGILTEGEISADGRVSYVILGIGINVTGQSFPEELSEIATSLEAVSGQTVKRELLIGRILSELAPLLEEDFPRGFMDEYRARNVVLERDITVIRGEERYVAYAARIDEDGALVVRLSTGEERVLSSGEVSVRF